MTLKENNRKIDLFGQVKKAHATGNHQPDQTEIEEILATGMAIAIFCTGCGQTQGLTQVGLDSLLTQAKIKLLNNPRDYLLICSHCPICSETFEDMELKKK